MAIKIGEPDWGKESHKVMFTAEMKKDQMQTCLILNAYWEATLLRTMPG